MALLELQAPDHADDLGVGLHAVLLAEGAARLLVVVPVEVHAVVDERARRASPALGDHLAVDRVRDHDQVVHLGRQPAHLLLVLARPDARRVHGRDDPGATLPRLAQSDRGLRAHYLGAVHVVVDHVGSDVGQVRREDAGGDRVVGLVDDRHRDAQALDLVRAAAGRERDQRHVVGVAVQARDEVVDVLLGTAVGAGGHDLDHADPVGLGGEGAPHRQAGVALDGRRHQASLRSRFASAPRRTRMRPIRSSTAPHSYL